MIYIEEHFPNNESVEIKVDGILDKEAVPDLRDVFMHHLENEKTILVDLTKIIHISREGNVFLGEFKDRVTLIQEM
jgi:predicted xylose isomerase-like sugar epimerase